MSNFKGLLHSKVTKDQYENYLLDQLGITSLKLTRIENNPGEINAELLEKISALVNVSAYDLIRDYGCGVQVLSYHDYLKFSNTALSPSA